MPERHGVPVSSLQYSTTQSGHLYEDLWTVRGNAAELRVDP